ncbi:MAG: class I SAM-dependent methyltransferase [Clostridiales bacterium]|jgi:tRNA (adenine22-N1)-methyltransferase|nr:class I SAM-dependent methyltransferase [Clostridiales bacterium]
MKTDITIKKVKLTPRMRVIAELVEKHACEGMTLIDVGCDHGYIPIYCVQSGFVEHAIAVDIRPGPMMRARENVARFKLEDKIELLLSDGLDKIERVARNIVVIAGMGGYEIRDILARRRVVLCGGALSSGEDLERLDERQAEHSEIYVIGAQKSIPLLLEFFNENGYKILEQTQVNDRGKEYSFYVVAV